MRIKQVRELSPMDRLLYWMRERESIRLKKEAGEPKPWTDDEILQSYRFCNVRRMDDKVSRWLMVNWYPPVAKYADNTFTLVAAVLARFFNLPGTLAAILTTDFPCEYDADLIKQTLRDRAAGGCKLFNAAYMVRGNDGADKISTVIDYTLQPLIDDPPEIDTSSMQRSTETLAARYGFGMFMAGQVIADLRWVIPGKWSDRRRWAAIGPGSRRGMNRLKERDLNSPLDQTQFEILLGDFITIARGRLPSQLTQRLEAIDYQNCLCEYDKYNRCLDGGRSKQVYKGA